MLFGHIGVLSLQLQSISALEIYNRKKLNIPLNPLSFNQLFSPENKNLFKNLHSSAKFVLIIIYVRTCSGKPTTQVW